MVMEFWIVNIKELTGIAHTYIYYEVMVKYIANVKTISNTSITPLFFYLET
jgi:hypothetical protein